MLGNFVREKMKGAQMTSAPINKDWIEEGDPRASLAILAHSDDCASTTILWECTAGKFTWRYNIDETIYFLDGEVLISVAGQPARQFGPGDSIHFSRGAVATWEVKTFIRKVAFCRSVLPRPFIAARRVLRAAYHRLRGRRDGLATAPAFG
ncbi:MAG: DUF861 domain-containing protein [Pseudomonadota bacterium]|nr:DUF861 domain-containing protein [Pseudomonadota bacterium]